MVPVEQLNNANFLHIYYMASEIKHRLEITPDSARYIEIPDFIYSKTPLASGYPAYTPDRIRSMTYLENIGMVTSYFHSEDYRKIRITPISQEVFFSFCSKLARIYYERFTKPAAEQARTKNLSDDQVKKLRQVLDVIAFKLRPGDSFFGKGNPLLPTTIPYNHFPSSLEPFDINGLLYKLANDFNMIANPTSTQDGISFGLPVSFNQKKFESLRKEIEERCETILKKERLAAKPTPTQEESPREPLKVVLVEGSAVSVTKTEDTKGPKLPYALPRGTRWEDVVLKFTDDDHIRILCKGKEHTAHYGEMGLEGKGGKPSVLWTLLRVLAMHSGELQGSDAKAADRYKKQKQSLSEALENYFDIDFDPFHPFQKTRSYKVKFTILPPDNGFSFEKKERPSLMEAPKKPDPFADLAEYMGDIAPVVDQPETSPIESR
jgi:hypothetical protein